MAQCARAMPPCRDVCSLLDDFRAMPPSPTYYQSAFAAAEETLMMLMILARRFIFITFSMAFFLPRDAMFCR